MEQHYPTQPEWLELDASLYRLAERWSWYWDGSQHRHIMATPEGLRQVIENVTVRRCCTCHSEILDLQLGNGIVAHLLQSHGYRMDGRQWNNRNELIGDARAQ